MAQPAATPAEPSVAQPAVASVEKTAAQPDAKPVEQTGALPAAQPVTASCPGNPHALGTSRVLTVTPDEFSRIGTIQYKQTLPLKDHEVVLTFDDGPIPPYSNIILDTLASQCVKATYFMVGEMAHAYPAIVRRIYNAGHTIGTHSQHHPFGFQSICRCSGSNARSMAASLRSMPRSAIRKRWRRSSAFPASAVPMRSSTSWRAKGW